MSIEEPNLSEYVALLRARVREASAQLSDDVEESALRFREEAFTEVVTEILEELGQISGVQLCHFEQRLGRGTGKVNGWYVDDDEACLDLFTTIHRGDSETGSITRTELLDSIRRAVRVFQGARENFHQQLEPASPAYDMMQRLWQVKSDLNRLRVVVLADGIATDPGEVELELDCDFRHDIWDLRRLFRADSKGLPYEPIEIDLARRHGEPLPCLQVSDGDGDCRVFLAFLPGQLLHSLYHEFGPRLLELNVRSFLQARGKVNRGIRDTLLKEPARFLAYNNGISVTAESVELVSVATGGAAIKRLVGLQIVNGGQTVASIHRAGQNDSVDLSGVHVQAKITEIRPEHVENLVPLISRYANTQNRVSEADFSANHPFHVALQQLSERSWVPGEQSRWFYERARGQYANAKAREAQTPANRKRFDVRTPARQRIDKVLVAKYLNSWDQLPHIVSRGSQKNFVFFMQRLVKQRRANWLPDESYYKDLVAQAIIFKRAEHIARTHAFPGYRANAITYTVALLSYRTAGRVDCRRIWNEQAVSQALAELMYDWMPQIYEGFVSSAEARNVTEWCKREECWRHIQTMDVEVSTALEQELDAGQPLPTVGDAEERQGQGLDAEDRENIARVMQVSPEEWIHISGWGAQSGELKSWQVGIAGTLAQYGAAGWAKVPSKKQAKRGVELLQVAEKLGGRFEET